jgi:hypothetical protein
MNKTIPFVSIAIAIAAPLVSSATLLSTPNVVFGASAAASVSGDDDDDDNDHKKYRKCKKHHDKDDKHKKCKNITEISKIWTAKNSQNIFLSIQYLRRISDSVRSYHLTKASLSKSTLSRYLLGVRDRFENVYA